MGMAEARVGRKLKGIHSFIDELYDGDLHAKRVESLAAATLGVMSSASLAVSLIGQALAPARGIGVKHAIKQVDRLLSNRGIDVWASFAHWVPQRVGAQKTIVVAMDWTDFDHDGQTTLALNLVTGHGRAAPLIWLTVWKEELAERRNAFEDACLARLAEVLPPGVSVTILADRGFGDHKRGLSGRAGVDLLRARVLGHIGGALAWAARKTMPGARRKPSLIRVRSPGRCGKIVV